MMTLRRAVLAPSLLLLLTLACGDAADSPRTGGTAVIAYAGTPRAANPLVAADVYSDAMNRWLLFLPLIQLDGALELEPRLAASWEVEGDSVVVFHLRDDVSWSDGRPTTAEDAAFTLRRALDPETGFPNRQHIAHWRRIEATDSFTLRVAFDPVRDPLHGFTLVPVLPAHALSDVEAGAMQQAAFNLSPVTNGPFLLDAASPTERWVFTANERFPAGLGGRPHLDRLVWRGIPESSAQEVELRAGEVDAVVGVRPEAYETLTGLDGLEGYERETLSYTMIAWNGRRPPLSDARVRTALGLGIDRQAIIDGLRGGRGTAASGPVPPGHWAYDPATQPLAHDTARARELLGEAGYADRDGDGTAESADGEPLRITLLVPAGSEFNRDLAQVVQSDLAGIGVDLRIQALDFGTLVGRITSAERDFDAVQLGLDADLRLDLRSLFHSASMDGPFQLTGLSDSRLDVVLDDLERETDREDARALWQEAQQILAREQPWSFLYYSSELIVARERLHGLEVDLRGVLHGAPGWWVEAGDEGAADDDAGVEEPGA